MKKFFALCLVLFMLPLGALADAVRVDLTLDAPAAGMDALLQTLQTLIVDGYLDDSIGLDDDISAQQRTEIASSVVEELKRESNGVYTMIDGAHLQLTIDEACMDASFFLRDQLIANAALYMEDTEIGLTTDLLPGLLFGFPSLERMLESEGFDLEELMEFLSSEEVEELMELFMDALNEAEYQYSVWERAIIPTVETGSFAGENYSGGVRRETITLDERDFMLLVSLVLHMPELDDFVVALEKLIDQPLQETMEEIHTSALNTALDNRYAYQLHMVYDINDDPIGYSLLVLDRGVQIAGASLSGDADGNLQLVISYGMDQGNVYAEMAIAPHPSQEGYLFAFQFVKDEDRAGLYTASREAENILLSLISEAYEDEANDALICNVSFDGALLAHTLITLENIAYSSMNDSEVSTSLLVNDAHIMTWKLAWTELKEDIAWPDLQSMKYLRVDDEDFMEDEDLQEALENLESLLLIRLFRAMPAELILQTIDMGDLFDLFN